MPASSKIVLATVLLGLGASARDVPQNVRDFYNTITGQGKCNNALATGFYSQDNDAGGKF